MAAVVALEPVQLVEHVLSDLIEAAPIIIIDTLICLISSEKEVSPNRRHLRNH